MAMKRYKSVEEYFDNADDWRPQLLELRRIILSTGLEESLKWSAPCYSAGGKLIVGIGAFKSYCGLWFFQGALLKDEKKVLVNAQQGRTKAMRQWRFDKDAKIGVRLIKAYVKEAIELAEAGIEIKPDRSKPIVIPAELQQAFDKDRQLQEQFASLSKGKQREYAQHITDAKRMETKQKRLAKILPMIATGIGLHDKYRNC